MTKHITEAMRHKVLEMLAQGHTREEAANEVKISYITLWRYCQKNLKFADACDNTRNAALDRIEDSACKAAAGFEYTEKTVKRAKTKEGEVVMEISETTKYYPPNPSAFQFILRNRRPSQWNKEKTTIELDSAPSVQLIIQSVQPPAITAQGGAVLPAGETPALEDKTEKKKHK